MKLKVQVIRTLENLGRSGAGKSQGTVDHTRHWEGFQFKGIKFEGLIAHFSEEIPVLFIYLLKLVIKRW